MIILFKRSFWTKNRLSILIPWMTPLALSVVLSFFNLPLAFMAFFILSVIARIVVVKRSPFADMMREDFEDKMKDEEIVLDNGLVLKTADIKKTKKKIKLFGWLSISAWLLVPLLPTESLAFLGYAFWLFFFQALSKSYLIAKDLPLNGFPFFRSRNAGYVSNNDRKISVGVMDNPTNPLHPSNIGNPANPNYIFR